MRGRRDREGGGTERERIASVGCNEMRAGVGVGVGVAVAVGFEVRRDETMYSPKTESKQASKQASKER